MLDTNMRKQTYNVNKTWDLLQTTGGKDEPSIPSFSGVHCDRSLDFCVGFCILIYT
jgi:hypothetical protein